MNPNPLPHLTELATRPWRLLRKAGKWAILALLAVLIAATAFIQWIAENQPVLTATLTGLGGLTAGFWAGWTTHRKRDGKGDQ